MRHVSILKRGMLRYNRCCNRMREREQVSHRYEKFLYAGHHYKLSPTGIDLAMRLVKKNDNGPSAPMILEHTRL